MNARTRQRSQQEINNPPNEFRDMMQAMMHEISNLHVEMNDIRERQERQSNGRLTPLEDRREPTYDPSPNYVRHHRGRGHLPLKEVRGLIPEFDGSANKLQEFLSATTYAVENINPLDELTLLGAVLCTKLKGRAMLDFQKIRNFAQLKQELEACYASKKNTIHLQIEFNTLKQKTDENARAYGLRTDKLAMELYESMLDGQQYTADHKRVILNIIQQQALENFQIGLNDDIKTVVRSRGYTTLQEAISAATTEEKIKEPTIVSTQSKSAATPTYYRDTRNVIQCQKCRKIGHHGRECRTSRYATRFLLPKPERHSRVNTVNKYCNYCKKTGHNREECWLLHE
ncbi:uncharacterized protein LOC105250252 [Camponotus floridanus]|uniref:uncharacterized protein LOC105250252 n=1 Tax=Camponotus floridanus TaxID=104421 RepID=UPI000DC6AB29|nr:uncharacterized protein LOC105250252 [Camponotus floridanus]XP_025270680.1 uncharacterized protein LOC105250252 [Camponotus floridanus]